MSNSQPDLLQAWRLDWKPDEIAWRMDWRVEFEERDQEREAARKERALMDRVTFGQELWGASEGQRTAQTDMDKLRGQGLPLLKSEGELAEWLGISLPRLRWYTHDRPSDSAWHYTRRAVPKKSGGERVILSPKRDLKAIQRKILRELLEKLPVTAQAHGFVKARSIVTNARPHVGQPYVLNIDLQDFFPTITFPRVRGVFIHLGYSFPVASALALLCTEHDRLPYVRGKQTFYVSVSPRHLVQGAPTSPVLANLVARGLDQRLNGLAAHYQLHYTRYADDLTFSGAELGKLLDARHGALRFIREEGFVPHPDKIHLYRRGDRQMVTGVVVNEKANTPRELRRRVRALLHQAQKTGLNAQNRENRPHFRAYVRGLIAYIHQADPVLGKKLLAQLDAIRD